MNIKAAGITAGILAGMVSVLVIALAFPKVVAILFIAFVSLGSIWGIYTGVKEILDARSSGDSQ